MSIKSKYAIDNPTTPKVIARGYDPVVVWKGGWYGGWRVKTGWKWQHIYLICDDALRRFPTKSKNVKELPKTVGTKLN
jgi:hypothetical protein